MKEPIFILLQNNPPSIITILGLPDRLKVEITPNGSLRISIPKDSKYKMPKSLKITAHGEELTIAEFFLDEK